PTVTEPIYRRSSQLMQFALRHCPTNTVIWGFRSPYRKVLLQYCFNLNPKRWCDSSRGAGCQRLNTKDVPRARRWLLVNSSEMWLVDRIKPNYKKTQRSSSEKQTDFNTEKRETGYRSSTTNLNKDTCFDYSDDPTKNNISPCILNITQHLDVLRIYKRNS
ncbi:hypothetical protein L9F63_012382, partial [Diploptera punctata]